MGKIRVLLIEDDKQFYEPMIDLIKQNNEPIDIIAYCENGQEALTIIDTIGDDAIDFVLCDIQMSNMGGMAFINQIKQKYSRLLSHIFVISTYIQYNNTGDIDLKQILIDNGVTLPAISKPCDYKEIISNISIFGISILNSDKEQKSIEEIQALMLNKSIKDSTDADNSIEFKIKQLLQEKYDIIVDENIKMTKYLYKSILQAYKMKDKKIFIMKKIYNTIAEEHNKEYPDDKVNAHSVGALIEKIIKERVDETYSVKSFVHDFIKLL